jgi:hypothetical protein
MLISYFSTEQELQSSSSYRIQFKNNFSTSCSCNHLKNVMGILSQQIHRRAGLKAFPYSNHSAYIINILKKIEM